MKRMRPAFFLVVVLVAVAGAATPRTDPLPQAASGTREERLNRIFAPWDRQDSPGVAAIVVQNGTVLYSHAVGMANLDDRVPMTPQTVFYVASLSKQFTAACIATLALEGRLSLDDDVRKYFPALPDYGRAITIRHLIHHTSGLRDYFALWEIAGRSQEDYFSNGDVVRLVSKQRGLNHPVGDEHLYTNSGYVLLAEIVRRVSGQSLGQFAAARIFAPLGMRNSHFNEDLHAVVPHRAVSYQPGADGAMRLFVKNFEASGDGNLLTTVEDLARWSRIFDGDATNVPGLSALLLTPGTLAGGKALDYAFGLRHSLYRGLKMINHAGSLLGFRGVLLYFPERRCLVVCLANASTINPGLLTRRMADVVLFDMEGAETAPGAGRAPAEIATADLDRLTGVYENIVATGDFIRVVRTEGRLAVHTAGPWATLTAADARVFTSPVPAIRLEFDSSAPTPVVTMQSQTLGRGTYSRVVPGVWAAEVMAARAGEYRSEELESTLSIELEGGSLRVRRSRLAPAEVEVMSPTTALAGSLKLVFPGAARGPADRVTLDSGRIKGMEFVRVGPPAPAGAQRRMARAESSR